MDNLLEQTVCIKFCVANGISCEDSLKMLSKTYGDSVLLKTQVYAWYKAYLDGRTEIHNLPHPSAQKTEVTEENIDRVKELVFENHRYSLKDLAQKLDISHKSVCTILADGLGIQHVAGKLVLKELNFLQKLHRKSVAKDMISQVFRDSTFIERIITGDETWIYEYDMQTSQESLEWSADESKRNIKVMFIVFFDCRGVVYFEFLPEGQTVTKQYYLGVMERLRENIRRNRPDLWENNSWILHHDNIPSHKAVIVNKFLSKNLTNVIEQPPYSPDMAPCDFFLFPKLKSKLHGTRFESIQAIKDNLQKELKTIPNSAFKKCMDEWVYRWHMCVASEGDYFEGEKIN